MNKKILFICSRLSPGPLKVIKNLQGILKGFIDTEYMPLEDVFIPRLALKKSDFAYRYLKLQEHIKLMDVKKLSKFSDRIFFVGWGAANNVLLNKLNKEGITPSLIMCSTIGQSDFHSIERKRLLQVIDNVKKGKLKFFLLNKRLYESLGKELPHSEYFPHTIDISQYDKIVPRKLHGINVDIFCSLRPGKNVMNQIFAFKLTQITGNLHINFNDHQINQFIKELGLKPVSHGWIEEFQYYNLVAAMTLSLQVTFTESFSYAVCERMCLAVPVLTSYDIYLVSEDQFLSQYLCIRSLDKPSEISQYIKRIIMDENLRHDIAMRCKERIGKISVENNKIARDFLINYR